MRFVTVSVPNWELRVARVDLVGSLMRQSLALASIGWRRSRGNVSALVVCVDGRVRAKAPRESVTRLSVYRAMTLHLHRAERADRLVEALGELLSTPLPDPFATEIVSVPTPGVERWLAQGLAHGSEPPPVAPTASAPGSTFLSPRRLVARAVGRQRGRRTRSTRGGRTAPVWPLLRVIDDCRGEAWARCCGATSAAARADPTRHAIRYAADGGGRPPGIWPTCSPRTPPTRPAMIESLGRGPRCRRAGSPLPADRAWQAELWRRLRDELAAPSPAERLQTAVARLRLEPASQRPPERMSVFGATRLDPDHLLVLSALGRAPRRPPVAAASLPGALGSPQSARRPTALDTLEREPAATQQRHHRSVVEHRLLAYLGRDVAGASARARRHQPERDDLHYRPTRVRPGRQPCSGGCRPISPPNARRVPQHELPLLEPADRSVQLHACHGPDRQVEVLREVLVGLLADDPTLEPRDIVVMCPDIETFAPLIAAAFGLDTAETAAEHPGHRLRVRLADRSLRQLNPLLGAAQPRWSGWPSPDGGHGAARPVRRARRWPASSASAPTTWNGCTIWCVTCGGALGPRRRSIGRGSGWTTSVRTPGRPGLDRLLLGVTMDETDQHFIGTALPLDDVDAGDVDLVGRLAECVARVRTRDRGLRDAAPGGRLGRAVQAGARAADRGPAGRHAGSSPTPTTSSADWPRPRRATTIELRPARDLGAARRRVPRPGQPGELPHRHADHVHDAADAIGAAPGGLPARGRRRRLSAVGPTRTATTSPAIDPGSATATRAARTGSCCWTR